MIKKILVTFLITTNLIHAENQNNDPQRFKKKFEENKIKNPQSGLKGEDPIRIIGKIIKVREYNDYNIFEIITDRNEKIDIRYRKNSILRKDDNVSFFCKEWNIMEYINCN